MKRWTVCLLACLLLTGCGAEIWEQEAEDPPVQAEAPVGQAAESAKERLEPDFTYDESGLANWQRAYADFLRNLCKREAAVRDIDRPDYDPNEYPYEIGMLSSGYCLYDIDKDGVPEMLVRYGDSEAAYYTTVYGWADGAEFYGVSADGFGGDTGWTALERYLAPGGVDTYADTPQTIEKLAWVDMNGDGRRECVLRLLDGAEGWPDQYIMFSEQNGTVCAYCLNYCGGYDLGTGGVFHDAEWGDTFAVSFRKSQCYPYTVLYDETVPLVEWEEF